MTLLLFLAGLVALVARGGIPGHLVPLTVVTLVVSTMPRSAR